MKLSFEINKNYLIYNALNKDVRMEGWVDLQNELWRKYLNGYKLLKGNHRQVFLENDPINKLSNSVDDLRNLFEEIKQKELYKTLLKETEEYKKWLENEWESNENILERKMQSILKTDISNIELKVFVVSNKMKSGLHISKGTIVWGHSEDFQNYSLIYLMHEMMHDMLESNNLTHAVIELATDNELRVGLNGKGEYFYINGRTVGHDYLLETEKRIENDWKEYLKNDTQNIYEFVVELESKYPELK